jgi:hypothetical protein
MLSKRAECRDERPGSDTNPCSNARRGSLDFDIEELTKISKLYETRALRSLERTSRVIRSDPSGVPFGAGRDQKTFLRRLEELWGHNSSVH